MPKRDIEIAIVGAGMSGLLMGIRLKRAGIELDRKVLADIAVRDAVGFSALVEQARGVVAKAVKQAA